MNNDMIPLADEYAYVGPAIFEMRQFPETVELVRERETWQPIEPHEVWCPINHTWVRLDGQWISGWSKGEHFAFRPSWLNRWKIRRATRAWEAKHDTAASLRARALSTVSRGDVIE